MKLIWALIRANDGTGGTSLPGKRSYVFNWFCTLIICSEATTTTEQVATMLVAVAEQSNFNLPCQKLERPLCARPTFFPLRPG